MAGDIAPLGFSVDTAPLEKAKLAANDAANAIGRVGNAVDNLKAKSGAANQWSTGLATDITKLNVHWGEFKKHTDNAGTAAVAQGVKLQALGNILNATRAHVGNLAASMGVQGGGGASAALGSAMNAATASAGNLASMLPRVGASAGAVAAGIAVLATAYVGLIGVLSSAQDKMAAYEARLKNALGSSTAARGAMEDLKKASHETGISFAATADSFLRIARNADALGASRDEVAQLSETVQKLGVISGASAGEVSSGMLQLSQALASGRLNGDELRSIMENMPALAKAIADGLKISVGELRAMGAAGELTSEKVFGAILTQTAKVNQEFKTMPDTAERAFQRMTDAASRFASTLGERIAASPQVRFLLKILEQGLDAADKALQKSPAGTVTKDALDKEIEAAKRLQDIINQPQQNFAGSRAVAIANATKALIDATKAAQQYREQEEALAASKDFEKFEAERKKGFAQVNLGLKVLKEEYETYQKKQRQLAEDEHQVLVGMGALAKVIEQMKWDEAAQATARYASGLEKVHEKQKDIADDFDKSRAAMREWILAAQAIEALGQTPNKDNIEARLKLEAEGRAYLLKNNVPLNQLPTYIAERRYQDNLSGAVKVDAEIAGARKTLEEQKGLTEEMRKGKDAAREYEARLKAIAIVMSLMDVNTAEATERIKTLTQIFSDIAKQGELQGGASRSQGVIQQIKEINAQIEAMQRGAYAMRQAQAIAASKGPDGLGKLDMDKFYKQEELQAKQAALATEQQIKLERELARASGDVAEQKRIQLEFDIKRAQENAAPVYAEEIRRQQEELSAIRQERALKESNAQMEKNIAFLREEAGLIGRGSDEYELQLAILRKKRELLEQGFKEGDKEFDRAVALTAEYTRLNQQVQKQKQEVEETNRIWTRALEGVQSTFADFFTKVFSGGVRTWRDLADSLKQIMFRTLGELAAAMVLRPLLQPIVSVAGGLGLVPPGVAQQYGGAGFLSPLLGGSPSGGGSIFGGSYTAPGSGSSGLSVGGGDILGGLGGIGKFFSQTLYGANPADYAGIIPGLSGAEAMSAFGVTPGVTLGGALSGVLGIGSGIFSLAQGNTIGGIAGLLGGALSFVPGLGPVGAAIGLLGGLLGSLFGKKKPKTPQAVTDVIFGDSGLTTALAYTRGKGGSALGQGTDKAGNALIDVLQSLSRGADLTFAPDTTGGWILNSIGKNTGNQWIAGLGKYAQPGSSTIQAGLGSAEEAIGMVAGAIFKKAAEEGKISGAGYTETIATILKNATLESIDDIKNALDFGPVYDDLKRGTENITQTEQAIRALNKQFAELKGKAEDYGLDTAIVDQRKNEAIRKLGTDFADNIRRGLLGMSESGQLELALEDLQKEKDAALKEAAYINSTITGVLVSINDVEDYYGKKREQIIKDANQSIVDSLDALYKSLTYGDLGAASPATRLAGTKTEYEGNLAKALAGDREAAGMFSQLAAEYLQAQGQFSGHNVEYGSVVDAVKSATQQLLALYGISGSLSTGGGATAQTSAYAEQMAALAAMVSTLTAQVTSLLNTVAELTAQIRRQNNA